MPRPILRPTDFLRPLLLNSSRRVLPPHPSSECSRQQLCTPVSVSALTSLTRHFRHAFHLLGSLWTVMTTAWPPNIPSVRKILTSCTARAGSSVEQPKRPPLPWSPNPLCPETHQSGELRVSGEILTVSAFDYLSFFCRSRPIPLLRPFYHLTGSAMVCRGLSGFVVVCLAQMQRHSARGGCVHPSPVIWRRKQKRRRTILPGS